MAFRTVVVSTSCKLELNLGYLVYRTIDESKRILIKEIHTLILQSTAVSITTSLLAELVKNKIKVIFCDEKHNPISELMPLYGNYQSPKCINDQIMWDLEIKNIIWAKIVSEKIKNQKYVLTVFKHDKEAKMLEAYIADVKIGDETNREGHSAKVYFNSIFGNNFSRSSDNYINASLNYGYSLIMSQINREIVNMGYLTQLGIHHRNNENSFNLSCDLMEPFRPIVDHKVATLKKDCDFKKEMIALLNIIVVIGGKEQLLYNAIKIYVHSIIEALNTRNISKILFFEKYDI